MPGPPAPPLDLASVGTLNFGRPDLDRFPCLRLAMAAGRRGGTYPAVMAAADEVAVHRFLGGQIGFTDIPRVIEAVMDCHASTPDPDLETVLAADAWARSLAAAASPGAAAR
jgi:1-deoxy-D-xylulose-5-phosphate reductoisomerase